MKNSFLDSKNKTVYKDKKFELNLIENGINSMELKIYENQYILTLYNNSPTLYICTIDDLTKIEIQNAYNLIFVIESLRDANNKVHSTCKKMTTREFCERLETEILINRSKDKQSFAKETGYKTATFFKD